MSKIKLALSHFIYLLLSLAVVQACWFSPLIASRQISNAYALPYIGVNISLFYVNLGLQAILSIPISYMIDRFFGLRKSFLIGILLAFGGSLLRLFAILGGYNGSFWILGVGHSIIGIATILLMISSVTLVLNTNNEIRRWYLSSITGSVPLGLYFIQFIYQIIFQREDTFFSEVDTAKAKVLIYMAVQSALLLCFVIAAIPMHKKFQNYEQSAYQSGFRAQLKTICKSRQLMLMIFAFGFSTSGFYLQLQKWQHITNQFNFTQSDAELFTTFFVFGCLLNCSLFIFTSIWFDSRPKTIIVISMLGSLAFLGTIMGTFLVGNVGLTTFIAFGIGFFLYSLINLIFYQTVTFIDKYQLDQCKTKIFALVFTLGGILSSVMTGVGDKIHYMNRDIKLWIYLSEGYVALSMVVTAGLLLCSTKY